MATMPRTTTTAGAAPPRVSTPVRRAANWPPAEAFKIHVDQASPALSSSVGSSTPTADVAAMVNSPLPASISGFALRDKAIRAPAMIRPATATATAIGRVHCWSLPTAGSAARSGEGSWTHQSMLLVTIQLTPDWIAPAIPDSASSAAVPAAAPMTEPTTLPTTQAGSSSTGHDISDHP